MSQELLIDKNILKGIQESFYLPVEELASDEMRITFMGTSYIPRVGQACNSVFIECGNGESFVFDCGSGVSAKYVALGVPYSRMNRVFLTHLHADHMSDLPFIYCFGGGGDRKTALHVYGPSGPIIPTPYPDGPELEHPAEGTKNFCDLMKQMCKWHTESFSFLSTGIAGPKGEKERDNGYNIEAHELPYRHRLGVAYTTEDMEEEEKVIITHFPAAHDRDGAISYKLVFKDMSVVFSGDTVPTEFMEEQADGVNVLIHEMQLDPAIWATKMSGLHPGDTGWDTAIEYMEKVVHYSHTPPKSLGKILARTNPQLGVITHFPVNQDTFVHALDELRKYYPIGPIALATDAMVLNLKWNVGEKGKPKLDIRQRMGLFSDYAWYTAGKGCLYPSNPKYEGAQWSEFISKSVLFQHDPKGEDRE